jgi:HD-like signal output (HDOD) protein
MAGEPKEGETNRMQATAAAKKAPKKSTNVRAVPAAKRANAPAPSTGERHQNEGHGRRLTLAFEALEAFPALAESRNRLLSVIAKDNVATADVVAAVESDVALITAVLRLANRAQNANGKVDTAVGAVELLSPQTVQSVANHVRTFDFFERASVWDAAPERFRLHALATQHAADRLAAEVGYENRDRLTVTSLLHDVGKLVLLHAYPG